MRLSTLSVLSSLILAAAPAVAQAPDTSPAKEVKKFEKLIGTWEGTGTVTHGPEAPTEKWTSRSSCKWVLGGHFVREDVRIDVPSQANPLEFISLYGWDRENKRYIQVGISNLGSGTLTEVHWTANGKMVTGSTSVAMGELVVDRWVTTFGDGEISFVGNQAEGDGPFYEMVVGTMKRTNAKATEVNIVNASFMPAAVTAHTAAIGKLSGTVGDYKMKGWFIPAPGAPKMDFTGTETVRTIFGGSVIEMVSKGDPSPGMPDYQGIGWIAWDDHEKCFNMTYANNMGEVNIQKGRKQGNKIIMTGAGLYQGQPTSGRGVIELAEDGSFQAFIGHNLMGDMKPIQAFEGIYEKK